MSEYPTDFRADNPYLRWLEHRAGGWQFGERGVLAAMAAAIDQAGVCVEIGAGNGDSLPLTLEPFYAAGRECFLFEMDEPSQAMLAERFPDAKILGAFVPQSELPTNIEVCVIDVDGVDGQIMDHVLSDHSPRVVMVEHMDRHFIVESTSVEPLPAWACGLPIEGGFNAQDSAEALLAKAWRHGYERVGLSRCNSIFVRGDLYSRLFQPLGSK